MYLKSALLFVLFVQLTQVSAQSEELFLLGPNEIQSAYNCTTYCGGGISCDPVHGRYCECKGNYASDPSGTCAVYDDCISRLPEICGVNEEYQCANAPNACNTFCYPSPTNPCPQNIECPNGCYCKDGYKKDINGDCVKEHDSSKAIIKHI